MKDLQLSVNNVDQCSSIFNHKDFSHAASLGFNFQTYTPMQQILRLHHNNQASTEDSWFHHIDVIPTQQMLSNQ